MFHFDWSVITRNLPFLLGGVKVTLYIVGAATGMGLLIGLGVGILRGLTK